MKNLLSNQIEQLEIVNNLIDKNEKESKNLWNGKNDALYQIRSVLIDSVVKLQDVLKEFPNL